MDGMAAGLRLLTDLLMHREEGRHPGLRKHLPTIG
jgi:hypothetical protein